MMSKTRFPSDQDGRSGTTDSGIKVDSVRVEYGLQLRTFQMPTIVTLESGIQLIEFVCEKEFTFDGKTGFFKTIPSFSLLPTLPVAKIQPSQQSVTSLLTSIPKPTQNKVALVLLLPIYSKASQK